MRIRAARQPELADLREIERAAGRPFRDIGMPEIADDEPPSVGELARYQRAGRAWVAVAEPGAGIEAGTGVGTEGDADADPDSDPDSDTETPVGYLIADLVDGNLHVEQVSVHPRFARRGVGRQLLDHLAGHAARTGVPALTLTTFSDVPWNAPYYARCGFVVLDDRDLTPGLRAIRDREAAHGLDRWPRVCMRRDL